MKLTVSDFCPLLREPCKQLGCSWFQHVQGMHPQTGEHLDEWRCAMSWVPLLLVETARQTRDASAEVNKLRNEVAERHAEATGIPIARIGQMSAKLIEATE